MHTLALQKGEGAFMTILYVEAPLVVNPTLATRIGLNEAIVVQQLFYWLRNNSSGVEHDGRKWIYNTYEEWSEQFPFWSPSQIKRVFTSLRKQKLIDVKALRKADHIRTNYYTINYGHEALKASKINEWTKSSARRVQKRPLEETQSVHSMGTNPSTLTETTTEITTETTKPSAQAIANAPVGSGQLRTENLKQELDGPKSKTAKTYATWHSYAGAYSERYGVNPVWNNRVAGQLSQFIDRIGASHAPAIAKFYLTLDEPKAVSECHGVGYMLAKAETLNTLWATRDSSKSDSEQTTTVKGGNEAWALALLAMQGSETGLTTNEIEGAMRAARPILELGDKVGARVAFLEVYRRLVEQAQKEGRANEWKFTGSPSASQQAVVVGIAVNDGLLSEQDAKELLKRSRPQKPSPEPPTAEEETAESVAEEALSEMKKALSKASVANLTSKGANAQSQDCIKLPV